MAVYDIKDISAAGLADKLAILCRLAGSQMILQLGTITTQLHQNSTGKDC